MPVPFASIRPKPHPSGGGVVSASAYWSLGTALVIGPAGTDSGTGWDGSVHVSGSGTEAQTWSLAGAADGKGYQLGYTVSRNPNNDPITGSVRLQASNADGSLVDSKMSGNSSWESPDHVFNFKAPVGTTKIRAIPTLDFNGDVRPTSCNLIVQNPSYPTPAPEAHQAFSHTPKLLEVMFKQKFAVSMDPVSPDVTHDGPIQQATVVGNVGGPVTISNGSPAVCLRANHDFAIGDRIEFTTTGELPAPLTPNFAYYVLTEGFVAGPSGAFEVGLAPGDTPIATSTSGSGAHRATKLGYKYLVTNPRAFDATDIVQLSSHAGAAVHGLRHRVLHAVVNNIYGIAQSGKRDGGFVGLKEQFNSLGDFICEGFNTDMGLDSHHNRYDSPAIPATISMSIGSPCIVTWSKHNLETDAVVYFNTTIALPTPVTAGTPYYVKKINGSTFNIAATPGGASINTSGSQSGIHTGSVVVTLTVADPCVLTWPHHGLVNGQPFTLSKTGALPTGVDDLTTYYVLSSPTSNTLTFGISAAVGTTPVAASGSQSGVHTINIAGTSNAGPIALDGNPNNPTAKCVIANGVARNSGDAIVDSKHQAGWCLNITYDISNGGHNVARCLMIHSYAFVHAGTYVRSGPGGVGSGTLVTVASNAHGASVGDPIIFNFVGISDGTFAVDTVPDPDHFTVTHSIAGSDSGDVTFSNPDEPEGVGFMGVESFRCPDLHALDGFGYPLRMEDKRCRMPVHDNFINDEKIVSLAHARARKFVGFIDESTYGPITDNEFTVLKLPNSNKPAEAHWPVLMVALQVRPSGTSPESPWFDVPLEYPGPFPLGGVQYQIDVTAIAGAGIFDGMTIDYRLGHYDAINDVMIWRGADGVSENSTLTLGAGIGPEIVPLLAAGTTMANVTGGPNWTCPGDPAGNGFARASGASAALRPTSDAATINLKDYLVQTDIGTVSGASAGLKAQFLNGGATVSGDSHNSAGTFFDEMRSNGNSRTQLLPNSSTLVCTLVKMSVRLRSLMNDAA